MSSGRSFFNEIKKDYRIKKRTYFENAVVYEFLHECSGIVDAPTLKLLKEKWKEKLGVEFVRYDIDKIKEEATITNNREFGFNLFLIQGDLNHLNKIDNIWFPSVGCPCYINIGDGFYYILAPFYYIDGGPNDDITLNLSKPQKSLSSFW